MDILAKLDELHAAGKMHGFSIWPSRGEYQANIAVSAANSFRIRHGATPTEAVAALFDGDPALELLPEPAMVQARDVFEPELPEPEDSIFD